MVWIKLRQFQLITLVALLTLHVYADDVERELQFLPDELADDIRRMKVHSDTQLETETDARARAEILGQLAFIYHAQQMLASAEVA